MKNIVKSIALIAILCSSLLASAQQIQQRSPQERSQNQTNWMQKNLGISEDQNKKAFDIIFKYAQQMDELRNAPKGKERRSEMQAISTNRENELKTVLTADQFQKYQAHEQEMKEKMRERRGEMQNRGGN